LLYCYHDELEWCERARAAGLRCYVEPAARVRHAGPGSELAQIVKAYFLGRNAELLSRRLRRPGLWPAYRLACALEGLAIALGRQPGDGAGWPARLRGRSDGRNGRPVDPWIAGLVRLDPEARL